MTALKVGESLVVSVLTDGGVRIIARGHRVAAIANAAHRALGKDHELTRIADAADTAGHPLITDTPATTAVEIAQHCDEALRAALMTQAVASMVDYLRKLARDWEALGAHVTPQAWRDF